MIQIVVTTHGHLAEELVNTTGLIIGTQAELHAICLEMHEGIEDLERKLTAVIQPDQETGCLVLVDMFGGTPSNVALMLSREYPVKVVTGVNLPMLLEAVTHRSLMNVAQLAEFIETKGKKSILYANALIANNHIAQENS